MIISYRAYGTSGDPGGIKILLYLQDDIMRIFGSEKLDGMCEKLGVEDGEAIIHPWINKAVEKAQTKVEARNFEIRKQLLKYDDVMNDQRSVIFSQRKEIMRGEEVQETVAEMRHEAAAQIVEQAIPAGSYHDQWLPEQLESEAQRVLGISVPATEWFAEDGVAETEIEERLIDAADRYMPKKRYALAPMSCAWRKSHCCCRFWISNGKTISCASINCGRAFPFAPTPKKIR